MTNHGRILERLTNMSVEQFAQLLSQMCNNSADCYDCPLHSYCLKKDNKWVDWLNAEEQPPFTKSDLKNGMFGRTREGKYFVLVNEWLVYQDGDYDHLDEFTDDLCCEAADAYSVDYVMNCHSFEEASIIYADSLPPCNNKNKILFARYK